MIGKVYTLGDDKEILCSQCCDVTQHILVLDESAAKVSEAKRAQLPISWQCASCQKKIFVSTFLRYTQDVILATRVQRRSD